MAYTFSLFMQRSLTGFANLEEVEYLEMRVDTRENSLGNFGKFSIKLSYFKFVVLVDYRK